MREISIGLLGIGTVGTGVLRLLSENAPRIEDRLGARVAVKRIVCRDPGQSRDRVVDRQLLSANPDDVLDDPSIDVVVELIGGVDPVRDYLTRAIEQGKHAVTANKTLMAFHGTELMTAAAKSGVDLFYEASVGGGIPVIRALREALASDRIGSICGIINGTTNYILSRMSAGDGEFADVLRDASEKGYAEADPSLDIDGHDAAQKLAILASLAFGVRLTPDDIPTRGIRRITAFDVMAGAEMGYTVKLLALARERDDTVEVSVQPTFVPKNNLLSDVGDVYNAVLLHSLASGPQLFYGKGAGMMPTASAVVSDVIEVCRNILQNRHGRIPGFGYQAGRERRLHLLQNSGSISRYYLRFSAVDQPGVLGRIATLLGKNQVSIAEMRQYDTSAGSVGGGVPIVMLTHEAVEGHVTAALKGTDQLDITTAPTQVLRVMAPEVIE